MELTEINIYPIKSLGGISLKHAEVENRGLKHDRRWMLVDKENNFLTQREFPEMAVLKTEINQTKLIVKNENDKIEIPFQPQNGEVLNVKIWSSRCRALVYKDEINDWFSDILKVQCKLVLMPDETRRKVSPFYAVKKYQDTVSFADAYPFLIIGESSLNDLNARLEKKIPMNRFRPNFVFDDSQPPFAEDGWKKIKIGETIFHLVKPCARCVMTTVDQAAGVFDGKEPLKSLADFRAFKRGGKRKILFGQNLIAENEGGILQVGDEIQVLETKN